MAHTWRSHTPFGILKTCLTFAEQFSNSPYANLVDRTEVEKYFEPLIQVLQKGIEQKIIKDVNCDILKAFMFYPIIALSNERICKDFEIINLPERPGSLTFRPAQLL
jgi:hypothetical protein